MQKPIQPQIDHLNKNLKKEIDERLGRDDRFRLTCYKLDERLSLLEKVKSKMGIRMHTTKEQKLITIGIVGFIIVTSIIVLIKCFV